MIKSDLLEQLDDNGFLTLSVEEVIEEVLNGNVVNNINLSNKEELGKYNETCKVYGVKPLSLNVQPTSLHELSTKWRIPEEYLQIDPIQYLFDRCKTNKELQRVGDELLEFKKRNQMIILNLMIYIVDTMRKNNIVWGIGRGSSVASFCLFLIGINKINPLTYDIDYHEFFK